VYAVQIGKQVYVLPAFQKKKAGSKTPPDIEIIKRRYRRAVEMEKRQ
jgi:phage-related protein